MEGRTEGKKRNMKDGGLGNKLLNMINRFYNENIKDKQKREKWKKMKKDADREEWQQEEEQWNRTKKWNMTLQEHDEREEEEILEKSGRVFFGEEEGHREERVYAT